MDTTFGIWLQQQRKVAGLTQAELADRVGCSTITIRKIEANERRPSSQIVERIISVLQIPPTEQSNLLRLARRGNTNQPSINPTIRINNNIPIRPLPYPPTPLIGRESEIAYIQTYLESPHARLINIIGPPGIGKSRLALEIAHRLCQVESKKVIVWISLVSISNTELIFNLLAQSLRVDPTHYPSVKDSVYDILQHQSTILILDNLEHLTNIDHIIKDLLIASEYTQILATSRVALCLRNEQRFLLSPLNCPNHEDPIDVLKVNPAVQLFIQRAAAIKPNIRLTSYNAEAIVGVCRQLNGIPLAIELIAAHSTIFSPQQLYQELMTPTHTLPLLESVHIDRESHHQSLYRALESSYQRLSPNSQRVLRVLGYCQTGVSLSAIQAILFDETPQSSRCLYEIQQLININLINVDHSHNEPYFTLYMVVREFAALQLFYANERDSIAIEHANYYYNHLCVDIYAVFNLNQDRFIYMIDQSIANIRVMLEYLYSQDDWERLSLACITLLEYWYLTGIFTDGDYWFNILSDQQQHLRLPQQILLIQAAGRYYYYAQDCQKSREWLVKGLNYDVQTVAISTAMLSRIAWFQQDYTEAINLLMAIPAYLGVIDSQSSIVDILVFVAEITISCSLDTLQDLIIQTSLKLQRSELTTDNQFNLSYLLGIMYYFRGNQQLTIQNLRLALENAISSQDSLFIGIMYLMLGRITTQYGHQNDALSYLYEAKKTLPSLQRYPFLVRVLIEGYAAWIALYSDLSVGITLMGASEQIKGAQQSYIHESLIYETLRDWIMEYMQSHCHPEEFHHAWQVGQSFSSFDEILALIPPDLAVERAIP